MLINAKAKTVLLLYLATLTLSNRSIADDGSTAVYFADLCSGEQTYVHSPNGAQLQLEITTPVPLTAAYINVEYVPAGLTEDLVSKYRIVRDMTWVTNQQGKIHLSLALPRDGTLNYVESKIPGFNIWNVHVSWNQTDKYKKTYSGTANSSIYRMKGTSPFFKITTDAECFWETKPSINSDYYYNELSQLMEIHRENILTTGSGGFRGFSLGSGPTLGGDIASIPLAAGSVSIPGMGWFFGEWSGQRALLQTIEIRRDWTLSKNEGGFFFDRFTFHRVQADRYDWLQPRRGCGSYVKTVSGALDVGSRLSEFNSVPLAYSGSPDLVLDFIEHDRPTADTCHSDVNAQARSADYLISSDEDNMMFFYPNTTSSNQ